MTPTVTVISTLKNTRTGPAPSVRGTFRSDLIGRVGADNDTRIAKATEQTATNTRAIKEAMEKGYS